MAARQTITAPSKYPLQLYWVTYGPRVITDTFKELIKDNLLVWSEDCNLNKMVGDPAPGVVKSLSINYGFGSRTFVDKFSEVGGYCNRFTLGRTLTNLPKVLPYNLSGLRVRSLAKDRSIYRLFPDMIFIEQNSVSRTNSILDYDLVLADDWIFLKQITNKSTLLVLPVEQYTYEEIFERFHLTYKSLRFTASVPALDPVLDMVLSQI